ncbi:MAG: CIA30 family protein [Brevinematales bacterium]|nr:CIA30 family protein [Brevinematales bacterium]
MLENLSPREQEIFDLLLEGVSPKEIAHKLNVSHSAVDFHRTKLYKKLGIHSIQELFAKYSAAGNGAPAEEETALPVSKNKDKRFKLLLPAGIALGIIMLAFSVLFLLIFVKKSSAYTAPKGEIIPVINMGFRSASDEETGGNSTSEVFISREEIDGADSDILNIKTNLVRRENPDTPLYANARTDRRDVIQRLRQANGIRFKARGDGKSWLVGFLTKESTAETSYAHYRHYFGTVRDQVIIVDIPYSDLFLPEDWEQY